MEDCGLRTDCEETAVSRFVLSNAVAAAERVIEARERIALTAPTGTPATLRCSTRLHRAPL